MKGVGNVAEDAHLQRSAVQGRSALVLGVDECQPALRQKTQIDIQWQALAATVAVVQEIVPGIDKRVVPRGGLESEQLEHTEQQGALRCMRSPEQGQIVVLMVGGDGLDVGAEGIDTTLIFENPSDLASQDVIAEIAPCLMHDLAQDADQCFLHLPVSLLQES